MFEWTLGNTLVAALFALLAGLVGHVQRSRPALSHFLWLVALGALLMPPLPLVGTPGTALRGRIETALARPAAAPGSAVSRGMDLDGLDETDRAGVSGTPAAAGSGSLAAVAVDTPRPSGFPSLGAWLAGLWLAGALIVLARAARRVLAFQRLVRTAGPAPVRLQRDVERVARQLGLRAPGLRLLAGVASPSVWCFGRPLLLWPADFAGSTSTIRSTLIAHELAHLARRDHWVSWLEVPASALLWWNPLFWLIRGRIRHFAELSCDAWAVWAYPTDRRAFAEALIDIQARTATAPVPLHGLGASDSEFKDFERRLNMIMKQRVSPGVSRGVAAAALLATVLASPGLSDGAWDKRDKKAQTHSYATSDPVAVARRVELGQRLELAEELYEKQQKDEALAAFREVVELDPENGQAHGRLGYLLISQGDLADAAKHFKLQYKADYQRPTALYNLACAKALMGQDEAALEVLEIAVQHGFTNTKLMGSDSDLATIRPREEFEQLVELASTSQRLSEQLARVEKSDDDALAYGVRCELAHVRSADGELVSRLGHAALQAGDYEEAAWAFERQTEVGYQSANGFYNAACAHALMGDVERGLALLERAADEGMAYTPIESDGDLDGLRADARFAQLEKRIVERGREREELKASMASGDVYAAMPNLKRVAGDTSRSAKERAWAAQALGGMLLEQGRFEDALATFEYAASLGLAVDRSAFRMAEALTAMGREEAALQHVEYAVELGFDDADAVRTILAGNTLCAPEQGEQLAERAALTARKGAYGKKGYGKAGYGKKSYVKDAKDGADASDAADQGDSYVRKKTVASDS